MRTSFLETLLELAEHDERVWLLTGDLGYSVLEPFAARFGDRYLNVGVAEQNMTGVAAGLASCGKVPFTYSIANFPTLRCLEQIRNDVVYHGLPVRIVSVGAGFAYGSQGYTHHGIEDLAVLRALPGMAVISPADPVETRLATRALLAHDGPAYLRLGKAREQVLHEVAPDFAIGRAITMRSSAADDVALIACGSILAEALRAADRLADDGVRARVISMPTIKPLDRDAIARAASETRLVVTVEEHSVVGGLGGAVAEVVAELTAPRAPLLRVGAADEVRHLVGSQAALRASAEQLRERVLAALQESPR